MTQCIRWHARFVLLFGLLAVFGVTIIAPAYAAAAPSATPAVTGNDDILIYDSASDTQIAEGWLNVAPNPKNPLIFSGTFSDNYTGGKRYPAVYDNNTTLLTINTAYGKFVFDAGGNAVSYPTRFGSGVPFHLQAKPHAYIVPTYTTFTMESVVGGGIRTSGQMTLTIDGWNAVVPDNPKNHIVSRITGTTGSKNFVAPITQAAIFAHTTNSSSTYSLIFSTKMSGQTYRFQSYYREVAGDWGIYDGFAYADGPAKHGVIYTWHIV